MSESDLEQWVAESIRISASKGYHPSFFIDMIKRHGAKKAMARLVNSGKIQSGLPRLKTLGLADEWSIEAGILKFPRQFSPEERAMAQFRLDNVDDPLLR